MVQLQDVVWTCGQRKHLEKFNKIIENLSWIYIPWEELFGTEVEILVIFTLPNLRYLPIESLIRNAVLTRARKMLILVTMGNDYNLDR